MCEADILEFPRQSWGDVAYLYFDLFYFHHYFQFVLATILKNHDTRQNFGINEKLKIFTFCSNGISSWKASLTYTVRSNPITHSHHVRQLFPHGTYHSKKSNMQCVIINGYLSHQTISSMRPGDHLFLHQYILRYKALHPVRALNG